MKIKTGLALSAVAMAIATPAFAAKTSVQGGQNACKAVFAAQSPAPSTVRVDTSRIKATNGQLTYLYSVKNAGDDKMTDVTCIVDRDTNVATLTSDSGQLTAAK